MASLILSLTCLSTKTTHFECTSSMSSSHENICPVSLPSRFTLSSPTLLQLSSSPITSERSFSTGIQRNLRNSHLVSGVGANVDSVANSSLNLEPSPEVRDIWRSADCVCFDVDSTVCEDEGIDELADFCGAGEAVAAWTVRAMTGSVAFEDALAARLDLFQPSAADLASFLNNHPPRLSPRIKELMEALGNNGADVYLISGGFRQMIEPAAALLNIPVNRIFANRLLFSENGSYSGFDRKEPTSRSGGKAIAIEKLKKEHGYTKLVMVGDGATDLEARRPGGADMFVGYGGVQVRPKVASGADWFVYNFDDLISTLA